MQKESSDDMNPAAVLAGEIAASPRGVRGASDYVALGVATAGVGFVPLAPGTWGSLVGVALYAMMRVKLIEVFADIENAALAEISRVSVLLITLVVLSIVGAWAATRTESLTKRKDPGIVVVDEVTGQLVAFLFVPFSAGVWPLIAGFFAFRLFDIWKPYPIRRLEQLKSGIGVMADDILAGIYAAIFTGAVVFISYLL
jgi:phosphatidylglycerophosphatase A